MSDPSALHFARNGRGARLPAGTPRHAATGTVDPAELRILAQTIWCLTVELPQNVLSAEVRCALYAFCYTRVVSNFHVSDFDLHRAADRRASWELEAVVLSGDLTQRRDNDGGPYQARIATR